MSSLSVIILAAGLGKRMKNELPKVLVRTLDGPMIRSVIEAAKSIAPKNIIVVTGHKRELVEETVSRTEGETVAFAHQIEQKGTGHAVQCAIAALKEPGEQIMILYGDTPLIKGSSLSAFFSEHLRSKATLSLLTILSDGSTAYGRILRDTSGAVMKIQEAKDCSPAELAVKEVNSGIYLVKKEFLYRSVPKLTCENAQHEYYLTDIVEQAVHEREPLYAHVSRCQTEFQGVNDFFDLALVNRAIMEERITELLKSGVQLLDPASVYIDKEVSIGPGTFIGPNVQLKGKTSIGSRCRIEGSVFIEDSIIGDEAHIKFSVRMERATVKGKASVGPFAHLRPETVLEEEVKVGNFVEVKKSLLKKGAKASHLTYLGDSTVGEDANIGAGTITCNYDGKHKHPTVIEAGAFIGSNTSLVAPVTVHEGATIGAGSVITKDIEAHSLALTRAPLVVKPGWTSPKTEKK